MSTLTEAQPATRRPQLAGQSVLVIGGSAGIGLETARLARAEGAEVIITARDPDRLHEAGLALGASIAAFDATDFERLALFVAELGAPTAGCVRVGRCSSWAAPAGAGRRRGSRRSRR